MWYKNIAGRFFGLVTKHACDRWTVGRTDGRTDGQNYDFQDRASIAASRVNKTNFTLRTFNDSVNGFSRGHSRKKTTKW